MGQLKETSVALLICALVLGPVNSHALNITTRPNQNTNQQQAQKKAADEANKGSKQAMMMGLGMLAAGAAMIAIGESEQNQGLIMAGIMMVGQGMLGLAGSAALKDKADQADNNAQNMGALTNGVIDITPTNPGDTGGSVGDLKIDPSLLKKGKLGKEFDNFEKATGLSRDEFANRVLDGESPSSMLKGVSDADIKSAMDTPLSEEDKAAVDQMAASFVEEDIYGDDSGASRSVASTAASGSLADYLKSLNGEGDALGKDETNQFLGDYKGFSPDVKRQLAQEGVTDKTLFQMVSQRYLEVSSIMLGLDRSKKHKKKITEPLALNLNDENEKL